MAEANRLNLTESTVALKYEHVQHDFVLVETTAVAAVRGIGTKVTDRRSTSWQRRGVDGFLRHPLLMNIENKMWQQWRWRLRSGP